MLSSNTRLKYSILTVGSEAPVALAVNKNNYTGDNLEIGTADPSVYNRTAQSATNNGVYSWTKTKVQEGDTWVAKAYVQYKVKGSDEIIVIYSDIVEVTK